MAERRTSDRRAGSWERLWSAADVAQKLNVSRSWVYHQAEAGLLPCLRIGGHLRFDPGAIRVHLRQRGETASVLRRKVRGRR